MNSLYVSDLDGTLLTNSACLSDYTRLELRRLLSEGLAFSVASARSVVAMQHILRDLPLELPVIEFNGAFLSDLDTGRHEIVNAIDPDVVTDLHDLLTHYGTNPFVSTFSGVEDCLYYCDVINDGMRWYVGDRTKNQDRRLRKVSDMRSALREQVVCLTCVGAHALLSDIAVLVREKYGSELESHLFENHYSPGWHWLTLHDRRASKDQAVRLLMEMTGFGESDLVVFGDQINDLKLFRMATEAVAVANAVPEVIAQANRVIGTNEDDSVVKFIRQHHRKKVQGTIR